MKDPYGGRAGIYEAVIDRLNRSLHVVAMRTHPVAAGSRVLDVGCGTGAQLEHYLTAGCDVSGVDLSPAMLDRAKRRLGDAADLRLADATELPYAAGHFDLVLASLMLHELTAPTRAGILHEIFRVLAPGGAVVIIDFGVEGFTPLGRMRRLVSSLFELAAGRDHFRAFRRYVAGGGVHGALEGVPLVIDREKRLGGGDLVVVVARRDGAS